MKSENLAEINCKPAVQGLASNLIVCLLGVAGVVHAQIDMDNYNKNVYCAQVKHAYNLTYYQICDGMGYAGYSLEKMKTVIGKAVKQHKCVDFADEIVISSLKQTTDIYCEKGYVYVGFVKQKNPQAYRIAAEKEQDSADSVYAYRDSLFQIEAAKEAKRKVDSALVERQRMVVRYLMATQSVDNTKAWTMLDSIMNTVGGDSAMASMVAIVDNKDKERALCSRSYSLMDSIRFFNETIAELEQASELRRLTLDELQQIKQMEAYIGVLSSRMAGERHKAEQRTGNGNYCFAHKEAIESEIGKEPSEFDLAIDLCNIIYTLSDSLKILTQRNNELNRNMGMPGYNTQSILVEQMKIDKTKKEIEKRLSAPIERIRHYVHIGKLTAPSRGPSGQYCTYHENKLRRK